MRFEPQLIGQLLALDGSEPGPYLAKVMDHAPLSFDDLRCGQAAKAIRDLRNRGQLVVAEAILPGLSFDGVPMFLEEIKRHAQAPMGPAVAEELAKQNWDASRGKVMADALQRAANALMNSPHEADAIEADLRASIDSLRADTDSDRVHQLLTERSFNHAVEPPPLRPIYSLAGAVICTPGNLASITSAVKTGKSAVIGAMKAAALARMGDTLGFTSSNPNAFALIGCDSEQSPDDHWHCENRALQRAGLSEPPAWFHSYCLTGLGHRQAMDCLTAAIKMGADTHSGIHSVLIDGIADLVADVNDPAECNDFVARLHDTAIKNDCPIVGVIHFNPGTEKTRGHLGSQFERKAETNLRLDKDGDVTTIWSDKQRRAPIRKGTGPCFKWSDEAGMHVSTTTRRDVEREAMLDQARDVFGNRPAMPYRDLKATVINALAVSDRTAERRIATYRQLGVVVKGVANLYEIKG